MNWEFRVENFWKKKGNWRFDGRWENGDQFQRCGRKPLKTGQASGKLTNPLRTHCDAIDAVASSRSSCCTLSIRYTPVSRLLAYTYSCHLFSHHQLCNGQSWRPNWRIWSGRSNLQWWAIDSLLPLAAIECLDVAVLLCFAIYYFMSSEITAAVSLIW